jgi:thiol-disulfide isomerase/thioredoxin
LRPLLFLAALAAAASPSAFATPAAASPAPDFQLAARSGGTVKLAELKGQVVMVNFWATWCGPCRKEMPLLDDIYRKYRPMGFTLLGVNVESDSALAEGFLAKVPVSFPILFDTESKASQLYAVNAMPTTVIIDRKGVVRMVHRGYKPGDESEYLDQVRALIRE